MKSFFIILISLSPLLAQAAEFRTQDNVNYVIRLDRGLGEAARLKVALRIKELAETDGNGHFSASRFGTITANLRSVGRDLVAAMPEVKIIETEIFYHASAEAQAKDLPPGPGFRTQDYVDRTISFKDHVSPDRLNEVIVDIQQLSNQTGTGHVERPMDQIVIANLSTRAAEIVAAMPEVHAVESTRADTSRQDQGCGPGLDE